MRLVCADTKLNISSAYLKPGFAFGGSCLPKDLRSLTFNARRLGVELPILEAVLPSNRLQLEAARLKVHELGARRVAVLGLSFKPSTDDLRESPIIGLIRELWQDGVDVLVYDPDVHPETMLGSNREYLERQLPQIHQILCPHIAKAFHACQVVIVSQKRPEFTIALQALDGHATVLDLVRAHEDLAALRRIEVSGDVLVTEPISRWLILTQYYPPEIGAPQIRLRAVAHMLRQHGIAVEVLTAMPNYPAGKIFPGYAGRWHMREEIDGIAVRRTWVYAGTGKSASYPSGQLFKLHLHRAPGDADRTTPRCHVCRVTTAFPWPRRYPDEMAAGCPVYL